MDKGVFPPLTCSSPYRREPVKNRMAPGLFPGPGPSVNMRPVCMARPFAPLWVNRGIVGPMTGTRSGMARTRPGTEPHTAHVRIAIVGYPADRKSTDEQKKLFTSLLTLVVIFLPVS